MPHAPAARPSLAVVVSVALALTAGACSRSGPVRERADGTVPPSPAALPSAAGPPVLTEGQARAALVTEADLAAGWEPTRGAATWRDEVLKARAERPDCHRLLDVLYTEDLFGADVPPRATAALDDADDGAQLHYRVTSHRAADIDAALDWLGTLPDACGHFTARGARGAARDVHVTDLGLPDAGDARRGLRVTVTGATPDTVLTVDLAAVRVGDDAITLTEGSLAAPADDATWTAAETGAARLAEVRQRGRAQV